MTIRNVIVSVFGMAAVSLTGALGCQPAQPSDAREGTIDFVVHQGHGSIAAASGSFDVRGIDNDAHAHVGIGSLTARTLHVRLPVGAYAVAWNPALAIDAASAAHAQLVRDESDSSWPQIVVVTSDRASVVDVLVNAQRARPEAALQLASAGARPAL